VSETPGFSGSISINSPAPPAMQIGDQGAGLCAGRGRSPQMTATRLSTPHKRYCGEDDSHSNRPGPTRHCPTQQMRRLHLEHYSEIGTNLTELMARGPKGPKCLWLSQASGTGDSTQNRRAILESGAFIWGKSQWGPFISTNGLPDEPHLGSSWPR
jgi:hypothetical protein